MIFVHVLVLVVLNESWIEGAQDGVRVAARAQCSSHHGIPSVTLPDAPPYAMTVLEVLDPARGGLELLFRNL